MLTKEFERKLYLRVAQRRNLREPMANVHDGASIVHVAVVASAGRGPCHMEHDEVRHQYISHDCKSFFSAEDDFPV